MGQAGRVLLYMKPGPVTETLRHDAVLARWQILFAGTAPEAERILSEQAFDVIVSADIEFLSRCRQACPRSARVGVLSAAEAGSAMAAVQGAAHSIVGGALLPSLLEVVLQRAFGGTGVLSNKRIDDILGHERLPVLSKTIGELIAALDSPDAGIREIARVIERDPALTARCLMMANSTYYGLPRRVATVVEAANYLGTSTIRTEVLATEAWKLAKGADAREIARLRESSLLASHIARSIGGAYAAEASAAAMLANIGALLVLGRMPAKYRQVRALVASGTLGPEAEGQVVGASFAQLGAALLDRWRLPATTCEAVAFSQTPFPHPSRGLSVSSLTYISCAFAAEMTFEPDAGIAPEWVDAMGLSAEMPGWRAVAQRLSMSWPGGV